MKNKVLLTTLFVAGGFLTNVQAQVQANKQLQMTGASNEDRRITGVGDAADSLDAVNVASVLHNRLTYATANATGNAYAVTLRVAPESYAAGMIVTFKASATNAGAMTLNVNGLGAKPVYKNVNEALEANDILANQVVSVIYDGTAFQIISQLKAVNGFKGDLAGDVTGTQSATVIKNGAVTTNKIADGAVTDAKLATGISYNKLVGAPTALPPTGTAGGDLAGTYPNPTIASGAVTNEKIASVAYSKVTGAPTSLPPTGLAGGDLQGDFPNPVLKDAVVSTAKVQNGAITADKLAAGVIPAALPPTGNAGGDLTGSYPNPVIADGAVNTLKIQDGAIISLKLADGSVLTAKIADAAITTAKVADGAITTTKLADGAVTNEKVTSVAYTKITGAPTALPPTGTAGGDLQGDFPNPTIKEGSITTVKVEDGAITAAKLAAGVIPTIPEALPPTGTAGGDLAGTYPAPQIAANAVTTAKIVDGAVTDAKIASVAYAKVTGAPSALPPTGDAGGDLEGTFPNPTIATGAVTGAKVADGAIANNHISATAAIAYSKLALANSITTGDLTNGAVTNEKITSVDYSKVTGAPTSLPPTGLAGGDLQGDFPNPVLKDAVVSTAKVQDNAITTAKLADGAVTNDKISSVEYSKITGAPASLPPTGDAGGDLEGSTYPNPVLKAGAVNSAKIEAGAVTTEKINTTGATSGQVLSFDGTGAVWSDDKTTPTGDAGGDLTGTYPNPQIADAAVTTNKVAAGAINNNHVADMAGIQYSKLNLANSIVGTDIANGAITTPKISNAAVTLNKISPVGASNGQVLTYNGSSIVWGTASSAPTGDAGGDLTGTYPNPVIASSTITSAKIADGAITNADINNAAAIAYSKLNLVNSIKAGDLVNSAVNTDKVSDAAITTAKIADGAVTDDKIASGISYSKLIGAPTELPPTGDAGGDLTGTYPNPVIATDAITEVKIADGAVVANKIGSGAVTATKIGNGAVTPAKINATGATAGQVLLYDGTNVVWSTPATSGGAALQFHGTITTATALPSGTKVEYSNMLLNTGSQMLEGVFTAAATGLYQFNASLPSTTGDPRFLALRVNGTDVFTGSTATSFNVGSPYNANISALSLSVSYPLEAGDQVEIIVYNNTGSATPLTNGSARLLITKMN